MKIAVLTSSRADYGIYLPLLDALKKENDIILEIITFGTHLSRFHGYSIEGVQNDNYATIHQINSLLVTDDEASIATSYGMTVLKFSDFWSKNTYDLVFSLGDRFEMSAAVQAGIPFQVKFAHIHGGETTLGAIDNIYRHQITIASSYHFTATYKFKEKVKQLVGADSEVYNIGSLSLNDIKSFKPIPKKKFLKSFGIPFINYILVTFHPETVAFKKSSFFAEEMKQALLGCSKFTNIIITMPNADTSGLIFRKSLLELKQEASNSVVIIENFGKINYFSAMYYSKLLLGNTSSGIIEAASFKKYVVNVGDRQKGRVQSKNTFNVSFDSSKIVSSVKEIILKGDYEGENLYFKENPAKQIINSIFNKA